MALSPTSVGPIARSNDRPVAAAPSGVGALFLTMSKALASLFVRRCAGYEGSSTLAPLTPSPSLARVAVPHTLSSSVFRRNGFALIVVAVSTFTAPILDAQRRTTVTTECGDMQWSPPEPFDGDPASEIAVRFPSMAHTANGLVALGNKLILDGNEGVTTPELVALEQRKSTLGQPTGQFSFSFPRAGADRQGTLHVVWGEPDQASLGAPLNVVRHIRSLWTASYSVQSRTWTVPKRVFESALFSIVWSPRGNAMFTDDQDALHVFALQPLPSKREDIAAGRLASSLVHLYRRDDEWTARTATLPGRAVEAVATLSRRRLHVAYVGPSTSRGSDNAVHFVSSLDGGQTWDVGRVVGPASEATPANFLTMLREAGGIIHLVWRQRSHSGALVLRHVESRDEGASWSAPHDLALGGRSGGEVYSLDRCGRLHVARDVVGTDGVPHVAHAVWIGEWSSLVPLYPDLASVDAGLVTTADGRLFMTFTGWQLAGGQRREKSWLTEMKR